MGGGSKEVKETSAQKAAAEIALEQWDLYQSEMKEFETGFIKRVDNLNSDTNMANVKKGADLGYARSYSEARTKSAENMAAGGLDPTSSKFQANINDVTTEQGIKQGDTINRAQVAEQDRHVAGLQDVTAIGMGQKAEAMAGLSDTASLSLRKATRDAHNDFNRSSANAQLVGAAAGAGIRYSMQPSGLSSLNGKSVDGVSTAKPVNTYDFMDSPDGTMMA